MALLDERMQAFCILDRITTPDGYGGTNAVWVDGAPFRAAAVQLSSNEMELAYQNGQKRIYAIYFKPIVGLEQNMRVKRLQDGTVYRITATPDPQQTSAGSAIGLIRTTMEVVSV